MVCKGFFTDDETLFVLEYYSCCTTDSIAKQLKLTNEQVMNLAMRFGCKKDRAIDLRIAPKFNGDRNLNRPNIRRRQFSKADEALIKELYPTCDTKKLASRLKCRVDVIITKANNMGVYKAKNKPSKKLVVLPPRIPRLKKDFKSKPKPHKNWLQRLVSWFLTGEA